MWVGWRRLSTESAGVCEKRLWLTGLAGTREGARERGKDRMAENRGQGKKGGTGGNGGREWKEWQRAGRGEEEGWGGISPPRLFLKVGAYAHIITRPAKTYALIVETCSSTRFRWIMRLRLRTAVSTSASGRMTKCLLSVIINLLRPFCQLDNCMVRDLSNGLTCRTRKPAK